MREGFNVGTAALGCPPSAAKAAFLATTPKASIPSIEIREH